jgi:electron transfer flavoprotein alpha subunit
VSKDILVYVEVRSGVAKRPSLEAISEGRRAADRLGGQVIALIPGRNPEGLVPVVAVAGPDRILTAAHEWLDLYHPEAHAAAVVEAMRRTGAGHLLISATALGRDLGARVAGMLEAGMASDCTQVDIVDGAMVLRRPVYSGKAVATVRFTRLPGVVTLRPNVFPLTERKADPVVEPLALAIEAERVRARTVEVAASEAGEIDVSEASIVVSGGRAMKGPENFSLIRELARALGGAVGASRAAVDAGWIDHQYQVGQTGKVVAPNLYIACGISGAIQHLAGMATSKVIVAVNKDPDAPIFKVADYGIVGDLYEVLPRLTEEVRRLKGQ